MHLVTVLFLHISELYVFSVKFNAFQFFFDFLKNNHI